MRFYRIEIDGGNLVYTSYATGPSVVGLLSGQLGGQTLPGALQVELDIPTSYYASTDSAGAFVKIWGVPIATIAQAKDLNGKTIKIFGGFQRGLPLANPQQSGLLVQGYIYQAFGNWIGTEMSLDLYVQNSPPPASAASINKPRNLTLNWKKGQSLSDALSSLMSTAFSGITSQINIGSNVVATQDELAFFSDLTALGRFVKAKSLAIVNTQNYQGVDMWLNQNTLMVTDGTTQTQTKEVKFQDLIGQPTWIQSPNITFKTAMRADIKLGDTITMPKTLITNTQAAQTSLLDQSVAFQGTFTITSAHHYGNYRQPDASAWVTVYVAYPNTIQGQT